MPTIALPNFEPMPSVHTRQVPSPFNNNQDTRLSHDPSLLYQKNKMMLSNLNNYY